MSDTLVILQGELKDEGHLLNTGNVEFFCPFCKHHKRKLQVNLTTFKWHCWVCNAKGQTANSLLKRIGSTQRVAVKGRSYLSNFEEQLTQEIKLPSGFQPLWKVQQTFEYKRALDYVVNKRRLSYDDIMRYNIGFCDSSEYQKSIIIPSYNNEGKLNFYSVRSYVSDFKQNPPLSKDVIGFESLLNWDLPVILTEASFNAISIRHNATPLYGNLLLSKLKHKLQSISQPIVYIALDGEARREANVIASQLLSIGKQPRIIQLDFDDPNELGYIKFKSFLKKATNIDEYSNIRDKIFQLQ